MGYRSGGLTAVHSDVLHPNRANVSKDDLRGKLAELYKCTKEQVNVFGLQTQFGGGKTTGFALVYDSPEALAKFEPHFRLVRVGVASKIEKPSRQQRMSIHRNTSICENHTHGGEAGNRGADTIYRQAAQEQTEDPPRKGQGHRPKEEEGVNLTRQFYDGVRQVLIAMGIGRFWVTCIACIQSASVSFCGGSRD